MSVVDASVVVDSFRADRPAGPKARQTLRDTRQIDAPQLLRAECMSALRRMHLRGEISQSRARWTLDRIRRLAVTSHPIEPFISRIWELRDTLTVYDAWYVALAETLNTTLFTTDRRLAMAPGPRCEITVI